jgi:hypothetical protein
MSLVVIFVFSLMVFLPCGFARRHVAGEARASAFRGAAAALPVTADAVHRRRPAADAAVLVGVWLLSKFRQRGAFLSTTGGDFSTVPPPAGRFSGEFRRFWHIGTFSALLTPTIKKPLPLRLSLANISNSSLTPNSLQQHLYERQRISAKRN